MCSNLGDRGKLRPMIAPHLRVLAAAAGLLACAAPGAPAQAQGVSAKTVVLGQSAPLTGASQALGEEIRNGALAYLRTLNDAGGVHGRRIEIATLDDAGEPARALANTQRLVEQLRVFALLAYPEASVTREVLAAAQQGDVPFFAPLTGAELVQKAQRNVVTVRASRADEVERVVEHYAQLGLKRFALQAGGGEPGEWREALARALKKLRLEAPVAADGADVVLLAAPARESADLVRSLRRSGNRAQVVTLSAADAFALAGALGREGAGVALAQVVPPLAHVALPLVAEYRAAYARETGGRPFGAASLESYLGAKVFAEAVRRAGPGLTRAGLMQALETMSPYDAGGYLLAYGRGDRHGSSRIHLLAIGRDGALLH
jgi:ABC-type branched-subunit amino acid transport system substrate-binding protein